MVEELVEQAIRPFQVDHPEKVTLHLVQMEQRGHFIQAAQKGGLGRPGGPGVRRVPRGEEAAKVLDDLSPDLQVIQVEPAKDVGGVVILVEGGFPKRSQGIRDENQKRLEVFPQGDLQVPGQNADDGFQKLMAEYLIEGLHQAMTGPQAEPFGPMVHRGQHHHAVSQERMDRRGPLDIASLCFHDRSFCSRFRPCPAVRSGGRCVRRRQIFSPSHAGRAALRRLIPRRRGGGRSRGRGLPQRWGVPSAGGDPAPVRPPALRPPAAGRRGAPRRVPRWRPGP